MVCLCAAREKEGDSCGKQGSYQKPQAALNSLSSQLLSSSSLIFLYLSLSLHPSLSCCSLAMLMIDGLRVLMGTGEQELRSGLSWQLGEGDFCCCFTCKLSSNAHIHTCWPHIPPCQHHLFHSLFLLSLRSLFLSSFSLHPPFLCLFSLLLLMFSEAAELVNCVYILCVCLH